MQETENGYLLEDDNVKVVFTKRVVDAKNNADVKNICKEYGFNFDNLVYNTQVHGANVRIIKSNEDIRANGSDADGLVTSFKKVPLLIFTADCVPLVFYDRVKGVVALAHAGWRGTYDNIAKEIIDVLRREYNSNVKDIKVIIGPSVSGENYEVSKELVEKFSSHNVTNYYEQRGDSYYLDLWAINKGLLKNEGVVEENIKLMDLCTVRDNNKFFSYRLDKQTTKRIGTFIELK